MGRIVSRFEEMGFEGMGFEVRGAGEMGRADREPFLAGGLRTLSHA
jgi:hypothetical protein